MPPPPARSPLPSHAHGRPPTHLFLRVGVGVGPQEGLHDRQVPLKSCPDEGRAVVRRGTASHVDVNARLQLLLHAAVVSAPARLVNRNFSPMWLHPAGPAVL